MDSKVRTFGAAILMLVAVAPASANDQVHFAPHRAVYEISLTKSVSGSGVAGLNGRMVYELSGSACEGYTQNMRFVTRMSNQEGGDTINDLRNSSWEEAAGKRLRFSATQYQDEVIVEASQGDANRGKQADTASVDLVKPKKSHLELPGTIYFPMQHATALIQAAKSGQKIFTASVYDGTEKGDKVYLTNAIIGKAASRQAHIESGWNNAAVQKSAARLAALQSWPMSISYFEAGKDKQDAPPAYELSYHFYENGVTSDLAIDYGEFAIKGELKELTFLPESACATPEH
jgi:EipB-like